MTRKTKVLGSTTGLLAIAAFSGLITGAANHASAATGKTIAAKVVDGKAGVQVGARNLDSHDCKGQNSCKGTGGCNTGDQGCKGKNSCKGKGGCKTSTTQPSMFM
ncbi:MAG: hypothetical protein ABSG31_08675 [Tepidisphaeraceae bacterium]|jgi:hypothetical protein